MTADLDWFTLRDRLQAGAPLVLPVGSYEQHGPHLPMTTDALIAGALAERVAERIGGVVLPTVSYGAPSRPKSGGGDPFPAPALSLRTLLAAIEEIARGAVRAGARRLVVVSWHMENVHVLWDALWPVYADRDDAKAILVDAPWSFLDAALERDLFGGAEPAWPEDHAGLLETAIMRHLAPDLVGEPPAPVPHRWRSGYDVLPTPPDSVPETGVVNDARDVTAEVGERCLEAMVAGVAAAVEAEA